MQHRGGKMDSFLNLSTQTQSTATPGEKSYGAGEPSTGSEEAMFNRWIEKANDQMFPRIEVGFVGSREGEGDQMLGRGRRRVLVVGDGVYYIGLGRRSGYLGRGKILRDGGGSYGVCVKFLLCLFKGGGLLCTV